jgi:DNA-binding NarL/FixJ family response regulator
MSFVLRIVLADDHALVREGLRALLADLPNVKVVGEAANGYEAIDLIAQHKPDIALVDVSMPKMNGLEVATRVCKEHPQTRVVIVSMHDDEEFVRRALVAGASGYLLKQSDKAELEMALRAIARGDTWLSPAVSKRLAADYAHGGKPQTATPFERLTPRQREVLQLIAEGLSTKEIAARLEVSPKTVEAHRAELMERLGIHGVAGLVRYAIRVGLVRPET